MQPPIIYGYPDFMADALDIIPYVSV